MLQLRYFISLGSLETPALHLIVRDSLACAELWQLTYSVAPAQAALKYRSRVAFDNRLYPNQFIGEPRAEVDEAWFQLLRSKSQVRSFARPSYMLRNNKILTFALPSPNTRNSC